MWAKLKGELGAAVAISGGILLAAGYAFVFAQLVNANVPVQPVLSALPTTVFISAAIESILLPFLVVLPFVIIAVARRGRSRPFPGGRWWLQYGIALAVFARVAAFLDARLIVGWNAGRVALNLAVAAAVVGLSAAIGRVVQRRVKRERIHADRKLEILAAVALVFAVTAASAYRIADAFTVTKPLPDVGVYLETEDCPPVLDTFREPVVSPENVKQAQCYVGGFYIGESDKWLFVAEPKKGTAPGRLLLLPRDSAKLAATAKEPLNSAAKDTQR